MSSVPIDKIESLIALSASSSNEEEARTAARTACKLIAKHELTVRTKLTDDVIEDVRRSLREEIELQVSLKYMKMILSERAAMRASALWRRTMDGLVWFVIVEALNAFIYMMATKG